MDEDLRRKCVKIIEDLCKHPISEIFLYPVDPVVDNVPNYLELIKHPNDLSTVRKRLASNKYSSVKEFKDDVDLIWENAETFNGRPSLVTFMADEMQRAFHKAVRSIEYPTREEWVSTYARAQAAMYRLFRAQPKPLEPFNLSPDTEMLVPERRVARSWLTAEDTKLFQEVFRFIDEPGQMARLRQILADNEPLVDVGEEVVQVNLPALSQKTLKLLKAYALELKERIGWQP